MSFVKKASAGTYFQQLAVDSTPSARLVRFTNEVILGEVTDLALRHTNPPLRDPDALRLAAFEWRATSALATHCVVKVFVELVIPSLLPLESTDSTV
jgi:hypothetical protein